jgi:UDP-sugar transporter A1/2/3
MVPKIVVSLSSQQPLRPARQNVLDLVEQKTPSSSTSLFAECLAVPQESTSNPSWNNVLVPVSLLGGTAALYTAVLRHPSSTLTPLSFVYMMLLAIQYSLQPRLSKRFISPKTNKQGIALAEETVKTAMAACILFTVKNEPIKWTLSSSLTAAGLPAVLYAIQGVLQYTSHQFLDPVTFNGLSQTKTISAALFCYLIMGKSQSIPQMGALVLLVGSALLFQGYSYTNIQRSREWLIKGVLPCLGATLLSGLAGAFSQRGLQMDSMNPYVFTMEVSLYSALTLLLSRPRNMFEGWTRATWIPIVWKAFGGVLTALVHKSSGSVTKGFALMAGLVLSGILQSLIQEENISPHQLWGTALVLMSGWIHFTNPAN